MKKHSGIICLSGIMVGILLSLPSQARMTAAMGASTDSNLLWPDRSDDSVYSRLEILGGRDGESERFDEDSIEEEAP